MGLWGSIRKAAKRYGRVAAGVVTGGASEQILGAKKILEDVSGITEARKAQDSAENEIAAEAAKLKSEKKAATAAEYAALEDARKKRARIRGRQSTILAGALGDTLPNFGQRTLLGV
ncbi:MAG: hypothetical protein ABFD81_09665 [Syntrophaceae bacterium]